MALYGRDKELTALASSPHRVVLVTGDIGIGKSALLNQAQDPDSSAAASQALLVAPVTVESSPGSLQRSLLTTLGEALALLASDEGRLRIIRQNLVVAAKRIAAAEVSDVAKVIGRIILGVVRQKLGDVAADAMESVGDELLTSSFESLRAQIRSAADPGVVRVFASFAQEALNLTDGRDFRLALDGCHRLTPNDLHCLADLPALLPSGIQLRVGFSVFDAVTARLRDEVAMGGAGELPIAGLDKAAIEEWLEAEGLDPRRSADVLTATSGYPLHIEEAVDLLKSGGDLEDLKGDELTGRALPSAWNDLELPSREAGILIAPWRPPVPDPPGYLGIPPAQWGAIESDLWFSRIFSVEKDGRRWFHEVRRRMVWDKILTDADRRTARERYYEFLENYLRTDDSRPDYLVELARLLRERAGEGLVPGQLGAVANLDREGLGFLAAALELAEPTPSHLGGPPAVALESVIFHARDGFGVTGDLVPTVVRLVEDGLLPLVPTPDGRFSLLATWDDERVRQLIRGRAISELGRLPIAGIASATFEAGLRPRLGAFDNGHFGVGRPSMGLLSQLVNQQRPSSAEPVVRPPRHLPGILVRASADSTPLYGAFTFSDPAARDRAIEATANLDQPILGRHFQALDVLAYPQVCVPSRRFIDAVGQFAGQTPFGTWLNNTFAIPNQVDLWVERHFAGFNAVRELMDSVERYAAGLEEPVGLAYSSEGDAEAVLIYIGGRRDVQKLDVDRLVVRHDATSLLHLADSVALQPPEWIDRITYRSTVRSNPVLDVLNDVARRTEQFNGLQLPRMIAFDASTLQDLLAAAAERRHGDTRALAPLLGVEAPEPRGVTMFMVIADSRNPRFVPAGSAEAVCATIENSEGVDRFIVELAEPDPSGDLLSLFFERFGLDQGAVVGAEIGMATAILARMLGYRDRDVAFRYPEESQPA